MYPPWGALPPPLPDGPALSLERVLFAPLLLSKPFLYCSDFSKSLGLNEYNKSLMRLLSLKNKSSEKGLTLGAFKLQ